VNFESDGTLSFASLDVHLTTASGDIVGTYAGVFSANGVISGTFQIDPARSTGAFAGATGTGTVRGHEQLPDQPGVPASGQIHLNGKITLQQ
jgi:hypothetical protein